MQCDSYALIAESTVRSLQRITEYFCHSQGAIANDLTGNLADGHQFRALRILDLESKAKALPKNLRR